MTDKPSRFRLLGQDLVLYRDDEGPIAMSDLCIHRGAALSLGWLTNGFITCPYHGWQYDRTGACIKIPSLPETSTIPSKARTIRYHTREAYGLVWVALAEPAAPIMEIKEWDDPSYHRFLVGAFEMKSSAGRVAENSIDFSHFAWTHEGILGSRDNCVVEKHEPIETESGLYNLYVHQIPASSPVSGAKAVAITMAYDIIIPFSAVSRQFPDDEIEKITILAFAICPVDEKTSRIYHINLRNYDHEISDDVIRATTFPIIEQDRIIIESQRPEEIPIDLREELHVKLPDAASVLYRRLLSKANITEAYSA